MLSAHYVRRLLPGNDLRRGIQDIVEEKEIEAAIIASAVGSLSRAKLRLAGSDSFFEAAGPFEIVSATGTVGLDGMHIHIAIADREGKTIGGHLVEGCIIYTTAEIVLSAVQGYRFQRKQDPNTGYPEFDPLRT
jgi:uncharacterized protein